MRSQLGVVAVVLLALGVGWGIGRTTALDIRGDHKIAKIEEKLHNLAAAVERRAPTKLTKRQGPDPTIVYKVSTDGSPSLGPVDATITIVEFSDYQCPFCKRVHPTLKKILKDYPNDARLVMKHNPLPFHSQAPGAAKAAIAAGKQGKFWEMHDRIFANEDNLDDDHLRAHAEALGLDVEQWEKDRVLSEVAAVISTDQALARRLGASGTPAFFVNGRYLNGAQPYDAFKSRIDEVLAKRPPVDKLALGSITR